MEWREERCYCAAKCEMDEQNEKTTCKEKEEKKRDRYKSRWITTRWIRLEFDGIGFIMDIEERDMSEEGGERGGSEDRPGLSLTDMID